MNGPLRSQSIRTFHANHLATIEYSEHDNGEWIVDRIDAIKLTSAKFTNSDPHK